MGDQARSLTRPGHPLLRMLGQTTVVLVLLTAGYYLLPLRPTWEDPRSLVRLGASLAAWGLLLAVFVIEGRRSRAQPWQYRRVQQLLSGLYLLILAFALVYLALHTASSEQFAGINSRTDALYFSVTIMSTVGFGDVHAVGAFARILVTVQMLFNLIYIGTAVRMLSARAADTPATS